MTTNTDMIELPADLLAAIPGAMPTTVEHRLWCALEAAYPGPDAEELHGLTCDAARLGPGLDDYRADHLRACVERSRETRLHWANEWTVDAALAYAEAVVACRYAGRDALVAWIAMGGEE
jgi:hypothetical protein